MQNKSNEKNILAEYDSSTSIMKKSFSGPYVPGIFKVLGEATSININSVNSLLMSYGWLQLSKATNRRTMWLDDAAVRVRLFSFRALLIVQYNFKFLLQGYQGLLLINTRTK